MSLLAQAISSLPDHYRIMIVLRHQQDLSYEEIAETLNVPLGTVKARIHRAREMLCRADETLAHPACEKTFHAMPITGGRS